MKHFCIKTLILFHIFNKKSIKFEKIILTLPKIKIIDFGEVDFVVTKQNEKIYIQVSDNLDNEEN